MKDNDINIIPNYFSRKRASIVNLIRSYTFILIEIIRGVIMIPIYLQYIDSRLYGAWLATGSIIVLMGLSDFGLSSLIVQKAGSLYGKKDYKSTGDWIGTSLMLTLISSLIPIIIASLIYKQLPIWINIQGEDALQITNAFWLATIGAMFSLISNGIGGIFLGLQKTVVLSLQLVIAGIISIIATLIFLINGFGILSIPLGLIVQSGLLTVGHMAYFLIWLKKNPYIRKIRFKFSNIRKIYKELGWVFFSRLSKKTVSQADNLIVASILDPSYTTTLSFSKKSSNLMSTIMIQISSSLMPSLAHLSGEGNREKLIKYIKKIIIISIKFSVFGIGGIFLLNKLFVTLWVGSEYYAGPLFTLIICLSGFVFILNTAIYNAIFADGKIITTAKSAILEAVIRIPLSVLLCYYWGINGVVLAVLLSVLPTSFLIQTKSLIKILNLSFINSLKSFLGILFKSIIPLVMFLLVQLFWEPKNIEEFFLFCLLYFCTSLIFHYYTDNNLRDFLLKVVYNIRNKEPN